MILFDNSESDDSKERTKIRMEEAEKGGAYNFGRIEGTIRQWWHTALLLTHPDF